MRRSLYAIFVLVLGVATVLAILFVSSRTGPVLTSQEGGQVSPGQPGGPLRINPLVPPGPLQKGVRSESVTVHLQEGTDAEIPAFTREEFTVHRGDVVGLTFRNQSSPKLHYLHSWVLIRPGSEKRVLADSKRVGSQRSWIPDSPDILAHTQLLGPEESETITFRVPEKAGDYPFVCLFPGHENGMHGLLHVR